jgi:hypothetical protein
MHPRHETGCVASNSRDAYLGGVARETGAGVAAGVTPAPS